MKEFNNNMKKKLEKVDRDTQKKKVRKYNRDASDLKTNNIYLWQSLNTVDTGLPNANLENARHTPLPKTQQTNNVTRQVSNNEQTSGGHTCDGGGQINRGRHYSSNNYPLGPPQQERAGYAKTMNTTINPPDHTGGVAHNTNSPVPIGRMVHTTIRAKVFINLGTNILPHPILTRIRGMNYLYITDTNS